MHQVTTHDIAKAAKVSRVTVSRVLNNHGNVTDEVRQRVIKAAETLGYRTIRSRALFRTQIMHEFAGLHEMGFLFHSLIHPESVSNNPFWSMILHGVEQEAGKLNIKVFYRSITSLVQSPENFRSMVQQMNIEGMLLVGSAEAETVCMLQRTGIPLVLVDLCFPGIPVDSVIADNQEGMYQAMHHLFTLGHKRIAYIGGPVTFTRASLPRTASTIYSLKSRLEGYFQALLEQDIPIDYNLVETGDLSLEGGYSSCEKLLQRNIPLTAIVCANDETAIGAMKAIQEKGLRVPDDISIIGFDDIESARHVTPELTTIRVNKESMGAAAVRTLITRSMNPDMAITTTIIRVELIERGSTSYARS
jgi:DNA-binding LacI/PurR family transcriptional regulator